MADISAIWRDLVGEEDSVEEGPEEFGRVQRRCNSFILYVFSIIFAKEKTYNKKFEELNYKYS